MNFDETKDLCKLVWRLCPAQKWHADTPATWAVVLADVTKADALAAVEALGKRQPFIAPAEIIAEVRRIRADRSRDTAVTGGPRLADIVPNTDPKDWRAYRAEVQALERVAAEGRLTGEFVRAYQEQGLTLSGAPARKAIGSGRPGPDVDVQDLKRRSRRVAGRRLPATLPQDWTTPIQQQRPVLPVREYTPGELADQREAREAALRALQSVPVPADTRSVDEVIGEARGGAA